MAQLLSNIRQTRGSQDAPKNAPDERTVTRGAPGVLIADDDPQIRGVMKEQLLQAGFNRLHEARDGVECLATLRQHPGAIKAVVLDVMMPELSGAHVIEQLGELGPQPPCVLLISGHEDSLSVLADKYRDRKTSFRVETLPKPFDAEQLIGQLKRMIMAEEGPSALVGLGSPLDREDEPSQPSLSSQSSQSSPSSQSAQSTAPTMQPMRKTVTRAPATADLDNLQRQLTSVEGQLAGLNTAVAQLRKAFDTLTRQQS